MWKNNEYENGYARPGTGNDFGEYSYIYTECGNWWYSVNTDPMRRDGCICPKCGNWWYSVNPNPMRRDGCICPKCGKTVNVIIPK